MKKVAIIDKAPNRNRYSDYFPWEFDQFHMSSVPIAKLLKKDVDLDFDPQPYDLIILVGAEAAKEYAKISSVTNMAGHVVDEKYVCMPNPAILNFKPEGKNDFLRTVDKIKKLYDSESIVTMLEGDFKGIDDTTEAIAYLNDVLQNAEDVVAWDTETTALYPRNGYILGVSVSYKTMHGRYIITDCFDDEVVRLFKLIADRFTAVFHNLKFDFKMIRHHLGIDFDRDNVHDTMLMHYALDENSSHGLKDLNLKYLDYGDYDAALDEFKREYCRTYGLLLEEFTYDLISYDIISRYAAIDPSATYDLYRKFKPIIDANPKLSKVYRDLLLKGTLFLMDMEEVGIPMSKERLMRANVFLDAEILAAKEEIYKFEEVKRLEHDTGKIFKPGSVQQLRKLLFDYLGLEPTGKKTATGAISTDAEVLEELAEVHPLPGAILKVRQLTKLKNTYISKILPQLDKDGRIRTNFNLIFTTSGRLSSSGKFNAQQIPRDDPIIKGCIVAPEGYTIVSQDLSTAEVYYASVLSGDKNLQEVFKTGGDLHSTIARMVFNLPCAVEDVKRLYPEMRQAAKAITFGILYGSGAAKVSESVTKATGNYYPIKQAQEDINAYFKKFHRLKTWLNEQKEVIEAQGFTYSHFGRKRRLSNVFSSDKGIASHEVRSGINALIQSVASDVNLLAAMETKEIAARENLDAHIFMLVHDSIVSLVKDEDVTRYNEIMKECTQRDRGCSITGVPIGVDVAIGKDYSFGHFEEMYEFKDDSLARVQNLE